jgi:hypothetical protein
MLLCALATLTEIVQPRVESSTVLVAVQPFTGDETLWVDASVRGRRQPHELFDSHGGGEQ